MPGEYNIIFDLIFEDIQMISLNKLCCQISSSDTGVAFDRQPLRQFGLSTHFIMKMPPKSCDLDQQLTYQLKQFLEQVLPVTAAIINTSLVEYTVPF